MIEMPVSPVLSDGALLRPGHVSHHSYLVRALRPSPVGCLTHWVKTANEITGFQDPVAFFTSNDILAEL